MTRTSAADWGGELRFGPGGSLAWFGDVDKLAIAKLAPTASDLAGAGSRTGDTRRLFFARRSALRHLVAFRIEAEPESVILGYDERGAPLVREPRRDVFVSISARGRATGLAVADRPVGIDLEPLHQQSPIPWDALSSAERDRILALSPSARAVEFLRHWTAKEAYLKALGTGLLRDPALIGVCWKGAEAFSIIDDGRAARGEGAAIMETNCAAMIGAVWLTG